VILLVLIGLPVVMGMVSSAVMRELGFSRRQAAARALAVAALSLLAGAVFAYDDTVYSLSEGGPEYYAFSPYVRYRRLDGLGLALTLSAYALVPAVLLTAAFILARRVGWRWPWPLLSLAAVAAVALPVIVSAALPRTEYGKEPVLHPAGPAILPEAEGGRFVETCFLYGVERIGVAAPDFDAAAARLCLYLADTAEARHLATVDYVEGAPEIYDIAHELNANGIKPVEEPHELQIDGLELRDARWTRE
jgi:hypothetical protein